MSSSTEYPVIYRVSRGLGNQIMARPAYEYLVRTDGGDGSVGVHFVEERPGDYRRAYTPLLFPNTTDQDTGSKGTFPSFFSDTPRSPAWSPSESEVNWNLKAVGCYSKAAVNRRTNWREWPIMKKAFQHVGTRLIIAPEVGIDPQTGQRPDKGYKEWDEVMRLLVEHGVSVYVVGECSGRLPMGVNDFRRIGLASTLSLMLGCRVIATNDSGLYHAASAMGVRCVPVFAGDTNPSKNHDPDFHRSAFPVFRPECPSRVVERILSLLK